MKRLVCLLVLSGLAALSALAADVTGKWSGTFATPQDPSAGSAFAIMKQSGSEITGTAGPNEEQQWKIQKGKIVGNKLTIEVTGDDGTQYSCDLELAGDHIKGDVMIGGPGGMKAKLDLARV